MSFRRRADSGASLPAILCTSALTSLIVIWVGARPGAADGAAQRSSGAPCEVRTPLRAVPGLYEGSGLALSRRPPARLFAINDSDAPQLVVLDLAGSPRGTIPVRGADVTDWEDLTTGPCAGGDCLYVSDVGDNDLARTFITVFRMREPAEGDRDAQAERIEARYPDGPHDAEAVFAGPAGRLYIMTKDTRGARIYAFPEQLRAGAGGRNRLTFVTSVDAPRRRDSVSRVTDAESTADGRRVAVRTNDELFVLPTVALLAGRWAEATRFSVQRLGEPQGEGVALGVAGDVFLLGEGGRRSAGTFARLTCASRS